MIWSATARWAVVRKGPSSSSVTVGVNMPCSSRSSSVAGNVISVDSSNDVTGSLTGACLASSRMVSGTGWRRADAESQDRGVVVEAVAEALEQGADGADGAGRGGRREAGGERPK